jgi:hypothetical protein
VIAEPLSPLEWTRRYGYLYPRHLFRAALVAANRPLHPVEIATAFGEWETRNAAWRSSGEQRRTRRRDERGRFAPAAPTP